MYKITKKFENFDGVEISQDFYFNMSKAELVGVATSDNGTFLDILKKIFREKDQNKLLVYFKEIVLMSYGERVDATHFLKNDEIRKNFECHAAFSDIYMDLATDNKQAEAFIKGVFPKDVASKVDVDKMSQEELEKLIENA